ncbi:DUF1697 domain-containing protein [Bacillus salipaludis]|uniref:DUF1697 domain-containing protein n=1 Tax=Bacillus salipaludis TaxID=2547811 RepID=A0A4R5VK27_9BACI|nr:DUF1697 domain-containing protein [Bacillus salipaludis]MDQ6595619.1 DUF1697 domain-containing protein [Bacillus salipaludis]TDK56143.1 DUF1697 domain-containing protein [Bacillus salipaludis]
MVYIALLRGINVGGHNKIKMADLKKLLESMGLKKVKTYIQSGNVVFESEEVAAELTQKIEEAIQKEFGFFVTVVIRTALELNQIIEKCPYSPDNLLEGESVHVAFLAGMPPEEGISHLQNFNKGDDEYFIEGQDVYLFFRQSIRNSKLAAQLPKLGVPATVRNWKTVMKLDSMVKEMEI